ncbi:hypothetical protein SH501x_002779 [Pirellulaceae bacterium SH501]
MAELEFADTKVIYEWDADRFRHRLAIRTADGWMDLMESVEGTSSEPWPPSPPWQQIVRESMGHRGEDVLLGVGLSGNGHWSIAVHPTNTEPSQSHPTTYQGLAFDVACKTSKPATRLGSTWKVGPLWSLPCISPTEIVFSTRSSGTETRAHLFVMHGTTKVRSEGALMILELSPNSDPATPHTHRWAMRVETSS